ncbi:DAPB [Candida margitis]|uniref:DAPB n=1 Tax=Candida margitis TaxID=1775924 RepID=UPI002226B75D|nr:DAPB [Candida margitis]KAI5967722.1 DAPB [Candida margitis]
MKDIEGKVRRTRNLKRLVTVGVVFGVLIWGSSFLISAIDHFFTTLETKSYHDIHFHVLDYESESNDAIFATPSRKPTEFGDKIPLNKKIFDEHTLSAKHHEIQWIRTPSSIHDDKGTYVIKNDKKNDDFEVVIKSVSDEEYNQILIEKSSFEYKGEVYNVEDFIASPDLQKVILKTNVTSQWRHSSSGLYWILDVATQQVEPVFKRARISTISWSPDSLKVAFIHQNNIYVQDISSNEVVQVTNDGSAEIFNGKPDWVYEEEVFGSDIVLWWSPAGDKFAFLKSNNSEVPEFVIPFYAQNNFEDYPEIVKIKYPKAGYPNPIVDVWTYDLTKDKAVKHELNSKKIESTERLITEVVWVGEEVLVKTSNRASDLLEVFLVGKEPRLVRSHTAEKSWFEITSHTLFVPKNKTVGRQQDGYIDTVVDNGFNHLAYFSPPDTSEYELLTKGDWEVVGGVGAFDYNTNVIYFTSTLRSSIERHIHSINLLDRSDDGLPYIRDITANEGYYSSSFSSGARFLFLSVLGPDVPKQQINDLRLEKKVKIIEDNSELIEKLRKYVVPEVKYSTVELQDEDGKPFLANAVEVLPLNFDKKKKYPVLFSIYGGPGSQMVDKRWSISFSSLVAAELDAVVVTVDGRGTGYNNLNSKLGSNFKFIVRDQLGKYEPRDLISAANIWAGKSYVDRERIAIWGWSYGGFLTLKTLETDVKDSIFNYAVAIAPVTKWKLYDSIYTERYLRTPQENPSGYETGSIHNATNFKHVKKFFIGHGSGDDNVHVQHSLQLLDEFNLAEVENFEFMIFPDSNHGMTYHNGQKVVYDRILDFFKRAFNYELD